jgi:hypothetical protein
MLIRSQHGSMFAALALFAAGTLVDASAAQAQCAAQPLTGCKQPTVADKALLLLKNKGGAGDKLTWKWVKGEETLPTDLGDPTGTTDHTLCVYDASGGTAALVSQAVVPGGANWEQTGAGFKYKDPLAANDGISKIVLKAGEAGKAKIIVKGKDDNLDMPTLPLAQDPQVVVQLRNSGGVCWEARYSPPTIKNETEQFKDKGDPPIAGPTPTATNTSPGGASTATPTAHRSSAAPAATTCWSRGNLRVVCGRLRRAAMHSGRADDPVHHGAGSAAGSVADRRHGPARLSQRQAQHPGHRHRSDRTGADHRACAGSQSVHPQRPELRPIGGDRPADTARRALHGQLRSLLGRPSTDGR